MALVGELGARAERIENLGRAVPRRRVPRTLENALRRRASRATGMRQDAPDEDNEMVALILKRQIADDGGEPGDAHQ